MSDQQQERGRELPLATERQRPYLDYEQPAGAGFVFSTSHPTESDPLHALAEQRGYYRDEQRWLEWRHEEPPAGLPFAEQAWQLRRVSSDQLVGEYYLFRSEPRFELGRGEVAPRDPIDGRRKKVFEAIIQRFVEAKGSKAKSEENQLGREALISLILFRDALEREKGSLFALLNYSLQTLRGVLRAWIYEIIFAMSGGGKFALKRAAAEAPGVVPNAGTLSPGEVEQKASELISNANEFWREITYSIPVHDAKLTGGVYVPPNPFAPFDDWLPRQFVAAQARAVNMMVDRIDQTIENAWLLHVKHSVADALIRADFLDEGIPDWAAFKETVEAEKRLILPNGRHIRNYDWIRERVNQVGSGEADLSSDALYRQVAEEYLAVFDKEISTSTIRKALGIK